MPKDESDTTQSDVWREHLQEVHPARHWAYLAGVLLGAFLLMLGLIAALGVNGG